MMHPVASITSHLIRQLQNAMKIRRIGGRKEISVVGLVAFILALTLCPNDNSMDAIPPNRYWIWSGQRALKSIRPKSCAAWKEGDAK